MIQTYYVDFPEKQKRLIFKFDSSLKIKIIEPIESKEIDIPFGEFRDMMIRFTKTFMEKSNGFSIHTLNDKVIIKVDSLQIITTEEKFNYFMDIVKLITMQVITCECQRY